MVRVNRIQNTRFPHRCVVYRIVGEESFTEGERVVLYEGECRFSGNTSLRTFYEHSPSGRVITGEYRLGIPITEGDFRSGDLADVVLKNGERKAVNINDTYVGTMGTTLYCKIHHN